MALPRPNGPGGGRLQQHVLGGMKARKNGNGMRFSYRPLEKFNVGNGTLRISVVQRIQPIATAIQLCDTELRMKRAFSKEVIWSAVFGGIGLAYFYRAALGVDRNVLHLVLWYAGCGFAALSVAAQPQLLFVRLERYGFRFQGSGRQGLGSFLGFLSVFCMALAAMGWLAT